MQGGEHVAMVWSSQPHNARQAGCGRGNGTKTGRCLVPCINFSIPPPRDQGERVGGKAYELSSDLSASPSTIGPGHLQ
jgi:hypothetical protein